MVMRTGRVAAWKSSLRQRGPLRDRARLRDALELMTARGMVMPTYFGRTLLIQLNLDHFGAGAGGGGPSATHPSAPRPPFGRTPYDVRAGATLAGI